MIRHAEKPGGGWPGSGLTEAGQADDKSLVVRGWQRTGAWAALFGGGLGGEDYPPPDAIYASKPGAAIALDQGPSRRPSETISAVAARLRLSPILKFAEGEEDGLVEELETLSGVVLVAWEHRAIVEKIIPKLTVGAGTPPARWPGDRFDVVLRFDRAEGQAAFAFRELRPCLLDGDSDLELGAQTAGAV